MFIQKIQYILNEIHTSPLILKKKCPDMIEKLQSQGNEDSEGTGNKVNNHEAAFATFLEENGFIWLPKKKKNDHLKNLPREGLYYLYQVNGTQASIDFELLYIYNSKIQNSIQIDCKHSTSYKVMLNDGWFEKNVLYIMTYVLKKQIKTFIGVGNTFTSEEENVCRKEIRELMSKINSEKKNTGNLTIYCRCANQYSLKNFTDSFITKCKDTSMEWISSQPAEPLLLV